MPRITTLRHVRSALVERGWSHADALQAIDAPDATAWVQGDALVASWTEGSTTVVHAIEEEAYGPTSELLAALLPALPDRLEARVGLAAAGILAEAFHIEMAGPISRMRWRPAAHHDAEPTGLVALAPDAVGRVRTVHDKDSPPAPVRLESGWLGLVDEGPLLAAAGPAMLGEGLCRLHPPRLSRGLRRDPRAPMLLACAARRQHGAHRVYMDLRTDRRDRREIASQAGFEQAARFERWRARRV